MRRRAIAIGPPNDFAIITGSSPASRGDIRMRLPSETNAAASLVPPHPRLIIATASPCARSRDAKKSVNGVLPLPPTLRLPTLMVGTPLSVARDLLS